MNPKIGPKGRGNLSPESNQAKIGQHWEVGLGGSWTPRSGNTGQPTPWGSFTPALETPGHYPNMAWRWFVDPGGRLPHARESPDWVAEKGHGRRRRRIPRA